ncbi:MAG: bifunctional phosphopantothenoylcysteine decarboxylase/phosphopantothenate--cysteine ligase CoaBC [Candidatus Aminicenantia bacterium]
MKRKKIQVALGISSSISIYKAADIIREFQRNEIEVKVIMTKNATQFITPLLFEALTGKKVIVDQFENLKEGGMEHINLAEEISLLVIAPATANIIGKIANGIADDFLTTFFLAVTCPIIVAPAMNENMYLHTNTQANLKRLRALGVKVIEPEKGYLACGREGVGRLAEPKRIIEQSLTLLKKSRSLKGKKILITAGPTQEGIDPVRFITNHSSGKMGYQLAEEAIRRGGEVTLISGPTNLFPPKGVNFISVTTALQMEKGVMKNFSDADIVVMAAAVSDYRPLKFSSSKIKKEKDTINLRLIQNPDILAKLGQKKKKKILVGFAAETEEIIKNATQKLNQKKLDLIVVNDVSRKEIGFGSDFNQVTFIDRKGQVIQTDILSKKEISSLIFDRIEELLKDEN